jgi:hypothetical protein
MLWTLFKWQQKFRILHQLTLKPQQVKSDHTVAKSLFLKSVMQSTFQGSGADLESWSWNHLSLTRNKQNLNIRTGLVGWD